MSRLARRSFVRNAALLPALLVPGVARATLMRGLTLRNLMAQSRHVLLLTPLAAQCRSLVIGGRPLIVTETSARVEDVIELSTPDSALIVVRTLGGVLNGAGLFVHGEAQLTAGASCVAFLTQESDGSHSVTGMAQGHFPLKNVSSKRYLVASPRLPELVEFEHSGVHALAGKELAEARQLVHEASAR